MIDNPYWDQVKHLVSDSQYPYEGPQIGDIMNYRLPNDGTGYFDTFKLRRALTSKYSWSMPSPEAIEFVVKHANGSILDPMAGSGYWEYVLRQSGVDCVAFDLNPPQPDQAVNIYHLETATFVPVTQADAAVAAALAVPGQSLFLSWPPMDDSGARALRAYPGNRVIYIGEGNGGCTGDDQLFTLLDEWWQMSEVHKLPQWSGIHDYIAVYDRIEARPQT